MNCTRCNNPIQPKQPYARTKRGPHHFKSEHCVPKVVLPDELMDGAVKVIRPTGLRNRIGMFMLEEHDLHIGNKVDAGKVQDMIEQFVRGELSALTPYLNHINGCQYGVRYTPPDSTEVKVANCTCGLLEKLGGQQ